MCRDCFLKGVDSFATWQDYESFSQSLQEKCAVGQQMMVANPTSTSSVNDFTAAEAYYQCSSCKEIWALSSPDNAWRGYFLPMKTAVAHVQRVKVSDRMKGIGGLILIVATLIFLLWKMLK